MQNGYENTKLVKDRRSVVSSSVARRVSLQSNKKPARYHFAGSVSLGKQKGTLKGSETSAVHTISLRESAVFLMRRSVNAFLRLLRDCFIPVCFMLYLSRTGVLHCLLSRPSRAFVTRSSCAGSRNPRSPRMMSNNVREISRRENLRYLANVRSRLMSSFRCSRSRVPREAANNT